MFQKQLLISKVINKLTQTLPLFDILPTKLAAKLKSSKLNWIMNIISTFSNIKSVIFHIGKEYVLEGFERL